MVFAKSKGGGVEFNEVTENDFELHETQNRNLCFHDSRKKIKKLQKLQVRYEHQPLILAHRSQLSTILWKSRGAFLESSENFATQKAICDNMKLWYYIKKCFTYSKVSFFTYSVKCRAVIHPERVSGLSRNARQSRILNHLSCFST